jgi:hypothetical protein
MMTFRALQFISPGDRCERADLRGKALRDRTEVPSGDLINLYSEFTARPATVSRPLASGSSEFTLFVEAINSDPPDVTLGNAQDLDVLCKEFKFTEREVEGLR